MLVRGEQVMSWSDQAKDTPNEKNPNHNKANYKATADKWVSDMLDRMEGHHPDSKPNIEAPSKYENNVDINTGNNDEAEQPGAANEAIGETHNTLLPNRKTKIMGPADGGRPWSAAHEKELKRCLLEYKKCPAEWDEDSPRFANMLKLMEQKEAHDEFARRRSFHEINEGWMYRTITSQRIKARKAMPLGFYHTTGFENTPEHSKDEEH
ncbi:hypothetical protein GX51_01991 [Blastomyces parvus]|uniref:Uncharacterized protein n=1 Tax=Blastomyces parvus TaxID=2060905 RepID=A0A2B7X6B8_9EURO|nr:hypothetical protein GX51_01991 [Blastomyces parvus]